MCVSRIHVVVDEPDGGRVTVEDLDGTRHDVSLLAYEGPRPRPGNWLVVHSGYALTAVEDDEVAATLAEWGAPERRHAVLPRADSARTEPSHTDPEGCR